MIESRLDEIEVSLAETADLVKKIHASHVRGRIAKYITFGLTVALGIAFYVFMRPFYETLSGIYFRGDETRNNVESILEGDIDTNQLQEIINLLQ